MPSQPPSSLQRASIMAHFAALIRHSGVDVFNSAVLGSPLATFRWGKARGESSSLFAMLSCGRAHRVQQQHHSGDPQSLLRKAFPLGFLTSQDSRSKHSAQCVAGLSTRRSHKSKVLPLGTMSTAPSTSRHGLDRLGRRVHTSSRRCFRDDNSMSRNSFHETAGEYTISLGR